MNLTELLARPPVLHVGADGIPVPYESSESFSGHRCRREVRLVIDDTQLWTGRMLDRFLRDEPGWERVQNVPMRASVFRCTAEPGDLKEWVHQPYVVRRSWSFGARGVVRKTVKAADALRRRDLERLCRRR